MKQERNILIIDPDLESAKRTQEILEQEGYSVSICNRLTEAIEKIYIENYNCILMDTEVSEMKVGEAITLLKNLSPDSEIIITSSLNTRAMEREIREHNIFYYYIKDFNLDELKQAIRCLDEKVKKEVLKMKKGGKILIIDDDADFAGAIKTLLEANSYQVVVANNSIQGLEKLVLEKPDCILLDIMIDHMFDGFSMCNKIRTSEEFKEFKDIPIIFVSSVKEMTGFRFSYSAGSEGLKGPNDYIDKPIKADVLLSRLEKLLNP